MFVGEGRFVIQKCLQVQTMRAVRHAAAQPASSSVSVAASSVGQLVDWRPFMPRARAPAVFDISAGSAGTSARNQQDLKLLEAASKLGSFMPMEEFGRGEDPRPTPVFWVDLDRWLTARFSIKHSFSRRKQWSSCTSVSV